MLAFYTSRIVATLYHRAFFLLLADFCAGSRWFLINNFTGLIDFIFSADYAYLKNYQNAGFTLAGLGFMFAWWMAHFLPTKQMWFNGVAVEVFLLTQLLGFLSNFAFTATDPVHPVIISAALFLLLKAYRIYLLQLRLHDPERVLYRHHQLRKPLVPNRALQLIQITPLCYAVLHKTHHFLEESTYNKVRYSLGMADALVYVGINLDIAILLLTRLWATVRAAAAGFSTNNFAWLCRVNITGSYTLMLRDFGWKSIPSDQLHLSWFFYWILKVIVITIHWAQTYPIALREPYFYFLTKELASSFVAATATVYFACLFTGTILTSIASTFTCSNDVVPRSSFLKGVFDTVQHVRWNSFPFKVPSRLLVNLAIHAILFGHVPLCGKMIQNIGQIVRKRCDCDNNPWKRVVGGIAAIVLYVVYSCVIAHYLSIRAPIVSECFAQTVQQMTAVWVAYNFLTAVVEIVTICIYQGLVTSDAREHLDKGTSLFRASMTGVLATGLTVVNIVSLHDSVLNDSGVCGYRDVTHAILQICARAAFVYITVVDATARRHTVQNLRNADSLTFHHVSVPDLSAVDPDPCGLCYDYDEKGGYVKLVKCGHTFHAECSRAWRYLGQRCPVCRQLFARVDPVRSVRRGNDSENEDD